MNRFCHLLAVSLMLGCAAPAVTRSIRAEVPSAGGATSCAPTIARSDPAAAELLEQIRALRLKADYGAAADLARRLVRLRTSDASARPWQVRDAEQLLTALQSTAQLPMSSQQELSQAEHLGAEAEGLWAQGKYAPAVALGREQLAVLQRLLGGDHMDVAESLNDLARFSASCGDYAEAIRLHQQALEMGRRLHGNEHPFVANSLNNLGALRYDQGDYTGAEVLWKESLAMRRRMFGEVHAQIAGTLNNLGLLYMSQGDEARAEEALREALGMIRTLGGGQGIEAARLLTNLGIIARARGDFATAEPLLREALDLRRQRLGSEHPDVAWSLQELAVLYSAQGDLAAAERLLREALAMGRKLVGEGHPQIAEGLLKLGQVLMQEGQWDEAAGTLRESLGIIRQSLGREHPLAAEALRLLARCLDRQGEPAEAEALLTEAARVFEYARLRAGVGLARATFQESPYWDLAAERLTLGKYPAAWDAVEGALGRTLADLLVAAGRRCLTTWELAREDSLRRLLGQLESQVMAFEAPPREAKGSAGGEEGPDRSAAYGAGLAEVRTRLLATEAAWVAFQDEMRQRHPARVGEAFPLERVQANIARTAALIGWLDVERGGGDAASWGYVVRMSGPVSWFRLEAASARNTGGSARASVSAFRDLLAQAGESGSRAAMTPKVRAEGCRLYRERFEPLVPALVGVEELIVIPSGAMLGMPVEALVDETGTYVGERFAVSYAPSATIHAWLREEVRSHPRTSADTALLVGDPRFGPEAPDNAASTEASVHAELEGGDAAAAAGRTSLPWTRREIEDVAGLFPRATVLLGVDASEDALAHLEELGALSTFGTIHLATHAHSDNRHPERSALLLSQVGLSDPLEAAIAGGRICDGQLTAGEIIRDWRLDAELVTLSACETGLGREIIGEGHVGLAHAFLQAGARGVLVSLWRVSDEPTARLMGRFYENRRGAYRDRRLGRIGERMRGCDALREAKDWLRGYVAENGRRPWEHPYYWAGFVLFGQPDR